MILLYHRIVADNAPAARCWSTQTLRLNDFRQHLDWLVRRFEFVPLAEYVEARHPWAQRLAALTFDDGIQRTIELVLPELASRRLTATMFIPTAHFVDAESYWFAYADALCFESEWPGIDVAGSRYPLGTEADRRSTRSALGRLAQRYGKPKEFIRALRRQYPLDPGLTDEYRSATAPEVHAALRSGCMDFGSHSVNHPYLDQLSVADQAEEIAGSRKSLEGVTGRAVPHFAYPAGAYNHDSVAAAAAAGFSAAFACVPHRSTVDPRFEHGRIGVYSSSLTKLVAKTFGAAQLLRAFNINAG
jgi:peptidoglycan/xylan/chitin deacetylase (PgdA/CDA1 family)